jgi:hypothetical protein
MASEFLEYRPHPLGRIAVHSLSLQRLERLPTIQVVLDFGYS